MTSEGRRVALDTNILVYAEGVVRVEADLGKIERAWRVVAGLPLGSVVVPVQVLGELFQVLTRKARVPADDARRSVAAWERLYPLASTTPSAFRAACDLSMVHGLGIWDSVIIAVAAEAGCTALLSEDMQAGFRWRGLTVVNPLRDTDAGDPLGSVFA